MLDERLATYVQLQLDIMLNLRIDFLDAMQIPTYQGARRSRGFDRTAPRSVQFMLIH